MIAAGQFRAIAERETIPQLRPGCVHIWRVGTAMGDGLRDCARVLSTGENAHAAQYYWERDRRSFMRCRAALRQLIGWYANEDAALVRIELGSHGKPFFLGRKEERLRFNVSHSGDVALLAFALDCEVGVDVEFMRGDVDFLGVAATVFSQSERDALLALSLAARAKLFYEIWSCKEACIKADGRGVSLPLEHFSIARPAHRSVRREVIAHVPGGLPCGIDLRVLDVAEGCAAAVAANAPFSEILALDYPGFRELSSSPRALQKPASDSLFQFAPSAALRAEREAHDSPGPDNRS